MSCGTSPSARRLNASTSSIVGAGAQWVGLSLLGEAGRAGDRSARPDRENERRQLARCLLPDLRSRGLVVGLGIGWIRVLVGFVGTGNLLGEARRHGVVAFRR